MNLSSACSGYSTTAVARRSHRDGPMFQIPHSFLSDDAAKRRTKAHPATARLVGSLIAALLLLKPQGGWRKCFPVESKWQNGSKHAGDWTAKS